MITFTMLVTIWIGPATYKFNVFTAERYYGSTSCERSMETLASKIRDRIALIKGAKGEISRECHVLETRVT